MAKNATRYFYSSIGKTVHAEPYPIEFKTNVYVPQSDYEVKQLQNAQGVEEISEKDLKEKIAQGAIDLPQELRMNLEKNEGNVVEGGMIAHTVTKEDMENHPDLEGSNIHEGDTTHSPVAEPEVEKENIPVDEDGKPREGTDAKENTAKKGRPASK